MPVELPRYLAAHIPGAELVELPGEDHFVFTGDADADLDEIEEFLTGERHGGASPTACSRRSCSPTSSARPSAPRSSATRAGASVLERHYGVARRELERFRGREVDTAGDGFLATFDGPARAIRCAAAIARRRARRSASRSAPACTPASAS